LGERTRRMKKANSEKRHEPLEEFSGALYNDVSEDVTVTTTITKVKKNQVADTKAISLAEAKRIKAAKQLEEAKKSVKRANVEVQKAKSKKKEEVIEEIVVVKKRKYH